MRTPGARPRAPLENEGALSPCPVQRPFSSQPRPPPNSAAPSERRPLAGLGKGPGPNEAAGLGGDPRPRQQGRSGLLLLPGAETTPGLPVSGLRLPRLGLPGSCRLPCHRLGRLLPAALPLLLHPAQPAHAPRPRRSGLGSSLRSASQEPIGAEVRGGAWMGRREGWARPLHVLGKE